jgi:hypothetical protein
VLARFLSNLFVASAGALLWVACFAFRPDVLGWLAAVAGCTVLVVVLFAFAMRGRGRVQRFLDTATMVVAAWTIVAGLSLHGAQLKWWSVGEAIALLTLGIAGMLTGELELRSALRRLTSAPAGSRD